jgi:hypothetical protein
MLDGVFKGEEGLVSFYDNKNTCCCLVNTYIFEISRHWYSIFIQWYVFRKKYGCYVSFFKRQSHKMDHICEGL